MIEVHLSHLSATNVSDTESGCSVRRQLGTLKKTRQQERRAQSQLFRGSLPPAPSPVAPGESSEQCGGSSTVQTARTSIVAWVLAVWRGLLQILFPAAIWQREGSTK